MAAQDDKPLALPISTPDSHPVFVASQLNPTMGAWDVCLMVGNFKSKSKAQRFADELADFLRSYDTMDLRAVQ